MGAILPPYVAAKTCPDTIVSIKVVSMLTPDCVCNDNYALTCDADGALTWYVPPTRR